MIAARRLRAQCVTVRFPPLHRALNALVERHLRVEAEVLLLDFPFHLRLVLRTLELPLGRWVREVALPVYPLLVLLVVAAIVLDALGVTASLLGVVATAAVALLAYWVAAVGLLFSPLEKRDVANALRSSSSRVHGEK